MRNKTASISVGIMVICTILLFLFTLFAMNSNSGKVIEEYGVIYDLDKTYSEKQGYENFLYFKLLESFLDSYSFTLSNQKGDFDSEGLYPNFVRNISSSFKNIEESSLSTIREVLTKSEVELVDYDSIGANVIGWEIVKNKEGSHKINYSANLSVLVSVKMLDLPSFKNIEEIYLKCKGSESSEVEGCLVMEFSRFNMEVVLKELDVEIESASSFYVGKEMKKMKFTLENVLIGK